MELEKVVGWLDALLKVGAFDDVSNNGLQIARRNGEVRKVAFAVDGSARSVRAASAAGADLLVVHHGISWGGGIARLQGGVYEVVKAAMDADLALYACHLPIDASERCGNNWELARLFGLTEIRPAFNYHGNVIGVVGLCPTAREVRVGAQVLALPKGLVGVCSGGAGCFAEEAKRLGCALYVTGEADWGEVIAAENCGMKMALLGHYETETFGVNAVAREMAKELPLETISLTTLLGKEANA